MPITQGRMEHLETGVKDNRDAILSLDTAIDAQSTTITAM